MQFEIKERVLNVVLDPFDKIRITIPGELNRNHIEINGDDKGLVIYGNPSIISSIHGKEMLEKVYIPPVISSEEIIEKCDKWLDMFKQVHDAFKKLVITDKYRNQHIGMELSFSNNISFTDGNVKRRIIDLDLKLYGTVIKNGVTISIDEANEDVYSYLVASVLDYFVSQNLRYQIID